MKPRSTGIQAKDIDTDAILRFVSIGARDEQWTMFGPICELMADIPPKVVRAKLAKLIRQGLLDGCTCGCRGDFELTEAGAERIGFALPQRSAGLRIDMSPMFPVRGTN
jgi:hypothetical protein